MSPRVAQRGSIRWWHCATSERTLDIPRQPLKNRGRILRAGIAVGAVAFVILVLGSLKPSAPGVGRTTLWVDSVRRGEMVREVRGPGTLVPEHVRFITATSAGRVDRVLAQPGQ